MTDKQQPSEHINDAVPYVTFKHTPGPWEFHQYDSPDAIQQFSIQTKDGKHICNAYPLSLNARANAELIARAPELLERVSALTKELEVLKQQHDFNCEYKTLEIVRLTEQVSELKSKLAKYEGNQID